MTRNECPRLARFPKNWVDEWCVFTLAESHPGDGPPSQIPLRGFLLERTSQYSPWLAMTTNASFNWTPSAFLRETPTPYFVFRYSFALSVSTVQYLINIARGNPCTFIWCSHDVNQHMYHVSSRWLTWISRKTFIIYVFRLSTRILLTLLGFTFPRKLAALRGQDRFYDPGTVPVVRCWPGLKKAVA